MPDVDELNSKGASKPTTPGRSVMADAQRRQSPGRSVHPHGLEAEITADGLTHIACEVSEGDAQASGISEQTKRIALALGVDTGHTIRGDRRRFQISAVPPKLLRRLAEVEAEQRQQRVNVDFPASSRSLRPASVSQQERNSPRMARWAMAAAFGASIGCVVTLFLHGHERAHAASSAAQPPVLTLQAPQACGVTLTPLGSECSESKKYSQLDAALFVKEPGSDAARLRRASASPRTPATRAPHPVAPELLHEASTSPMIRVPTSLHPRVNALLTSDQVFND